MPLDSTKTASVRISDLTLVLTGASGTVTSYAYNSMTFENLIIYHYAPVTLTNCNVRNCLFLGSSTNAVTIAGSSNAVNCQFNNAPTKTSTGAWVNIADTFTFAPPSDPYTS